MEYNGIDGNVQFFMLIPNKLAVKNPSRQQKLWLSARIFDAAFNLVSTYTEWRYK